MSDRGDRIQPHQLQVRPQYGGGGKGFAHGQVRGVGAPSLPKVLATAASVPVGGGLLMIAGFTLLGTLIAAAITTPLFIIFSPILVPAAITFALAVTGFLTSGAFGLTALSALSWVLRSIRQNLPEQVDNAKRGVLDMTDYVGQKTKDVGQTIQNKAHEAGRDTTTTTTTTTGGGGRTTDRT